jgi:hypothetical protein
MADRPSVRCVIKGERVEHGADPMMILESSA